MENYTLKLNAGAVVFESGIQNIPEEMKKNDKDPFSNRELKLKCRMGDPDMLHCAVFHNKNEAGGFFRIFLKKESLYLAYAQDNLTFSAGMGYFGNMVSNARYGMDIFEELVLNDD